MTDITTTAVADTRVQFSDEATPVRKVVPVSSAIVSRDDTTSPRPFNKLVWHLMMITLVMMYGSYTILVHLCEVDGRLPFSPASAVFLTELLKLLLSLSMLVPELLKMRLKIPRTAKPLKLILPFSVPAIIYCISNNLRIIMQPHMDPATYQVLSNMKILSTAFLYRIVMKRHITRQQWVSLILLAAAGITNSYVGLKNSANNALGSRHDVIHISFLGLVMLMGYCFLSGLSGVYAEYIMKKDYQVSIHLQNALLYIFGLFLNGGAWMLEVVHRESRLVRAEDDIQVHPFRGYSIYTWLMILSQTFIGLLMSAVFKYSNNLVRLFLMSAAMLVTTILSVIIFNLQIGAEFVCTSILVVTAMAIYRKR